MPWRTRSHEPSRGIAKNPAARRHVFRDISALLRVTPANASVLLSRCGQPWLHPAPTPDKVASVAALLLGPDGGFITAPFQDVGSRVLKLGVDGVILRFRQDEQPEHE